MTRDDAEKEGFTELHLIGLSYNNFEVYVKPDTDLTQPFYVWEPMSGTVTLLNPNDDDVTILY